MAGSCSRCRSSSIRPTHSSCRLSSRHERRVVLPLLLMVPVLFIAGVAVRLLRRRARGARLPAQLQRRRVQHRGPRERVLRLLRAHPDLGRAAVPDPGRDARGDPAGDRHPRAAGRESPLRGAGDRGRCDAAARNRPGHDADLDGPALRPLRALAACSPGGSGAHPPQSADGRPPPQGLPSAARGGARARPSAAAAMLYVGDSLGVGTSPVPGAGARRGRARGRREDRPPERRRGRRARLADRARARRRRLRPRHQRRPGGSRSCWPPISSAPPRSPAIAVWSSRRSTARRSTASRSTASTAR